MKRRKPRLLAQSDEAASHHPRPEKHEHPASLIECKGCGKLVAADRPHENTLMCLVAKRQDRVAFAQILGLLDSRLTVYAEWLCKWLVLCLGHAPDIVQQGSHKVLGKSKRYDCDRDVMPYFKASLRHAALDIRRSENRTPPISPTLRVGEYRGDDATGWQSAVAPASQNPLAQLLAQEAWEMLEALLNDHEFADARFIRLRLEGTSYREIGELVGCSTTTAFARTEKAAEKLRKKLE